MPFYFAAIKHLEGSVVSNGVAENASHMSTQGQVFSSVKCSIKVNLCSLSKSLRDGSTFVSEETTGQAAK